MLALGRILLIYYVFWCSNLGIRALTELPAYFPRCHRSDMKMEECLLNATEMVRPYVSEGIPDFIPAIKEFFMPQITVDQRGNRAFNFFMHINNVSIFGMDHYKFKKYKFNSQKPSVYLEVDLPDLYIKGTYDIQGNLFFATLNGKGNIYCNISDSTVTSMYFLDVVKKNGIGYLHTKNVDVKMRIGNVTDYGLDGLFSDSKDLELLTDGIFKRNINILVDEITPAIEKVISVFQYEIIGKTLEKIPYDKLYPK